jgi:hypothetical protein
MKNKKVRISKGYIVFFVIVILMLATAYIEVPCPVCQATGDIENSNMAWVSINDIKATSGGVYLAFCGVYRIYITDISLTLFNNSERDANGYLSLILLDYTTGRVLDNQYVVVNVPARKQVNAVYNIFFQTNVDDPQTVKVAAKAVSSKIADKACNGTGYVKMNSWPLYVVMKDKITQAQQVSVVEPVFQPFFLPPEDWDVPYAYDMEVYDEPVE